MGGLCPLSLGEPGKDVLERLSSRRDSERRVETDLADPELIDPDPIRQKMTKKIKNYAAALTNWLFLAL